VIGFRLSWVITFGSSDNITLLQGGTIMNRDNTNQVVRAFDDNRCKALALLNLRAHPFEGRFFALTNRQEVETSLGQYDKLSQIDRVSSFTQYLALWSTLPAVFEEGVGILEGFPFRDNGSQGLGRVHGYAVAGKDVADLTLRNCYQWREVNTVLKWRTDMPTTA